MNVGMNKSVRIYFSTYFLFSSTFLIVFSGVVWGAHFSIAHVLFGCKVLYATVNLHCKYSVVSLFIPEKQTSYEFTGD